MLVGKRLRALRFGEGQMFRVQSVFQAIRLAVHDDRNMPDGIARFGVYMPEKAGDLSTQADG